MKRSTPALAALVALFVAAVLAAPAAAAPGYVSRAGTGLVDPAGAPLKLNAVNLGGYLMWEGWIIGAGLQSESQLYSRLCDLVGPARAAAFRADLRASFVTLADLQAIRALGFNAVRLPFNQRLLANDGGGGFATLDRVLDEAEQAGLYVVLDLHSAPGGQNFGFTSDPEPGAGLWLTPSAQDRTVATWRAVAARYANRPVVAGYDLINEPDGPTAGVTGLYQRLITAIRAVDPNHLVITEGNHLAHDFGGFARWDPNQAYSFHQYPFDSGDLDVNLLGYVQAAQAADVPLWDGEYGQGNYATVQAQADRFHANPAVAGQALWTWKIADRNRFWGVPSPTWPSPDKFRVGDDWFAVANYLGAPTTAPRPSPETAEAGLQSFITAVAFPNTTVDPRMADVVRELAQPAAAIPSGGAPAPSPHPDAVPTPAPRPRVPAASPPSKHHRAKAHRHAKPRHRQRRRHHWAHRRRVSRHHHRAHRGASSARR